VGAGFGVVERTGLSVAFEMDVSDIEVVEGGGRRSTMQHEDFELPLFGGRVD